MPTYEETVFQMIVEDYKRLKELIFEADSKLLDARAEVRDAIDTLKQAETDYNDAEAALLLAETEEGGRINGPNADTRKRQQIALLVKEKEKGGKLYKPYNNLIAAQSRKLAAETDEQSAIDHLSAVKYVARMQAGTASALACLP